MSGGHFNSSGYLYYKVDQFADELENEIENNDEPNDWNYCPEFSQETLEVLKRQVIQLRKMAKIMKAIDYLYAADYGEDTCLKVIREVEESK